MVLGRPWTGFEAVALQEATRKSVRDFAAHLGVEMTTVANWRAGLAAVTPRPLTQELLDTLLVQVGAEVRERFEQILAEGESALRSRRLPIRRGAAAGDTRTAADAGHTPPQVTIPLVGPPIGGSAIGTTDDLIAIELARRTAASDVGSGTVERLEWAVDDLSSAYATTAPTMLLQRLREYLRYTTMLMDSRKTLDEHRRLVVAGGWLALLAATCHVDMGQQSTASVYLSTADELGEQGGQPEIRAWCLETRAWEVLVQGDFSQAVELSRRAQSCAPRGSSVYIQATAQEGRALSRLQDRAGTYDALRRLTRLVSSLPQPEQPEHHFRYDPAKFDSYVATTLAWLGDSAAEFHARQTLDRLLATPASKPRRLASAQLDLGLALVKVGKPEEAVELALTAVNSGRLVPSNYWRVDEVLSAAEEQGADGVSAVRDAFGSLYS
ncbi:XRE family transcriptional regulator [Nocardia sp. alder85J]|uniref:XRE family transcriptional regulator n=1 Tax=Nocardia sp. alder85J TaxID=2862949 RepID=UPI001CD6EF68|nr:XRE family transcriptional regulator [Nocardia sp. alder85J]MCX4096035.1 XRE family transcriptional regulator [Nocardia sp. alder85J]